MAAAITNNLPHSQPGSTRLSAYVVKRRRQREEATRRLLGRVIVPIRATRKPDDPVDGSHRSQRGWLLAALAYLGLALLLHLVGVGAALFAAKLNIVHQDPDEQVTIELMETAPSPVVAPAVPESGTVEGPNPEVPAIAKVEPKIAKQVQPPPSAQIEPPKQAPLRVVGLSLDSISADSGGPGFAVGNTRMGDTGNRATDPSAVQPISPLSTSPNRAASRIPVAGVTFTLPERKTARPPPYPELLRHQGIEAEVVVVVNIDTQGKVSAVTIAKGSIYDEFNEAAKTAALAEEFTPATKNGEAVPYSLKYTYFFRLTEV